MFRGCAQLRLLAPVYAFCGGAVVFPPTGPHLDENECALLLHDEIDLTEGTAIVARQERETGRFEIFSRPALGGGAVSSLSE
jgi:hypothetical protein